MDPSVLSAPDVARFVEQGWVLLPGAFPLDVASRCRERLWSLVEADGIKRDDPSSWPERHWISEIFTEATGDPWGGVFSERLNGAIDDLCGAGRWNKDTLGLGWWVNTFPGVAQPPWGLSGHWHVDGSFRHRADSKEGGLLVVFLFSDIGPEDGGTLLSEGSHLDIARILLTHDSAGKGKRGIKGGRLSALGKKLPGKRPIEVQGRAGDVVFCHPLMLHARSKNLGTKGVDSVRFMCHPCIELHEDMCLDRADPADYSPVERAIVRVRDELGNTGGVGGGEGGGVGGGGAGEKTAAEHEEKGKSKRRDGRAEQRHKHVAVDGVAVGVDGVDGVYMDDASEEEDPMAFVFETTVNLRDKYRGGNGVKGGRRKGRRGGGGTGDTCTDTAGGAAGAGGVGGGGVVSILKRGEADSGGGGGGGGSGGSAEARLKTDGGKGGRGRGERGGRGSRHGGPAAIQAAQERKRSLAFWDTVTDGAHAVKVETIQNSTHSATLVAVEASLDHLLVQDLETALGVYPSAMLRGSDLLTMEVILTEDDVARIAAQGQLVLSDPPPLRAGVGQNNGAGHGKKAAARGGGGGGGARAWGEGGGGEAVGSTGEKRKGGNKRNKYKNGAPGKPAKSGGGGGGKGGGGGPTGDGVWLCECGWRNRPNNTLCGGTNTSHGCSRPRETAATPSSSATEGAGGSGGEGVADSAESAQGTNGTTGTTSAEDGKTTVSGAAGAAGVAGAAGAGAVLGFAGGASGPSGGGNGGGGGGTEDTTISTTSSSSGAAAPPAASFNNSPSSKNFTISMEPKNPYGPALEKYESSVSIVVLHIRISVYLLGVHAYTAVVLTLRFSPCFSPFASSQVLGTTVPFVFAV
jgi:hypothetical protein